MWTKSADKPRDPIEYTIQTLMKRGYTQEEIEAELRRYFSVEYDDD